MQTRKPGPTGVRFTWCTQGKQNRSLPAEWNSMHPATTGRQRNRTPFAGALAGVAVTALALTGAACGSTTASPPSTSATTVASTTTRPSSSTTSPATTTAPVPVVGPPGGPIPTGFQATSFTAVSLDAWWMLGTARCLTGSGTCGAILRTTDGGSVFAGIPRQIAPMSSRHLAAQPDVEAAPPRTPALRSG
jgi:hypothetical protein